jgi:hypothetical protein
MNRSATYIATFAGALLGALTLAEPAQSADFYGEPYGASPYQNDYRYAPGPYYQGAAYRLNCCGSNCSPCGCSPCGPSCSPCGCGQCGCTWQCGVTRNHVIERHVVERNYYERRYAVGVQNPCCSYGYGEPQWRGSPVPSRYEEWRPGYGGVGVRWASPYGPYGYAEPHNGYGYPE